VLAEALAVDGARQPGQRLVGCCRDFTVLFVPMARHKGIPSRNKTEMLLWEDWGVLDSPTAPGPHELPVLDELAALTGQPSPPRPTSGRPTVARSSWYQTPWSAAVPPGRMSRRSSTSARWPGQPADRRFGEAGSGATSLEHRCRYIPSDLHGHRP
jgi:transglutaminase-like putative cysteine protease